MGRCILIVIAISVGMTFVSHYVTEAWSAPFFLTPLDGKLLVCYYTPTRYFPSTRVPGDVCTHIIYAFGSITDAGTMGPVITPPSTGMINDWNTLTALRTKNPGLKILLSLQNGFLTAVGADISRMEKFATNAVAYLRKYGFDGVDLDWEFPNSTMKIHFSNFLTIVRQEILNEAQKTRSQPLLLTLALPNNQIRAQSGYDIPTIASTVDFAMAMAYDFHIYLAGHDTVTGYNSPLNTTSGDPAYFSASALAQYYLSSGLPGGKLLLGIPTYGRSWKLASPSNHELHAPAIGKGDPGPYRNLSGVYTVPDACMALTQGATRVWDNQAGAVYLYRGSSWVAYDDATSVTAKCSWAMRNGLGGVGVWAMHLDDIDGACGTGTLPLITTMQHILMTKDSTRSQNWHMHNGNEASKVKLPKMVDIVEMKQLLGTN